MGEVMVEQLPAERTRPKMFRNSVEDEGDFLRARESLERRLRSRVTVKPQSKSLVVPATRSEHPLWLPLTNLDRVVNPTFVGVIFFYENVLNSEGYGKSFQEVVADLKGSLAKVLVDFYPLAGRLTLMESGLVDLQCNDAGAIFVESTVNVELSQLGGPQPMPMLSGMDVMEHFASPGPGVLYIPDQINPKVPVLVVQVSRFVCGSVAVAANWHHTVADGFSGCLFMRSWAHVATGQPLSFLPSHDRHLLKPRSPLNTSSVTNGNYGAGPKLEQPDTSQISRQQQRTTEEVTVVKLFILTKDTVRQLKEKGNTNIADRRPFTSTEAVSAELWRLITRARRPDDEESRRDRSRFFMFVDGRKRLGLPAGYFGNVVCSACAASTEDELLARPLSYAASLIQSATRGIDDEYFRSLIDWVEERGLTSSKGCKSEHVNSTGFDVAATFWTFFPLYEINFGWGKPVLSVRNAPPRKRIDGISVMPSPDGSGNMLALLNLDTDRMNNLERNPEFRQTAQPLELSRI